MEQLRYHFILGVSYYDIVFWGVPIIVGLVLIFKLWNSTRVIVAHWHHSFDNFQYSPQEFYSLAQKNLEEKQLPDISFTTTTHFEKGMLSTRREYLRLKYKKYRVDICAAPFGSGFYVSWYLVERRSAMKEFLRKWKFLASILDLKTYYQYDTEIMFKELFHAGLVKAVNEMTAGHGVRLSEADLKYSNTNTKSLLT